VVKPTYPTCDWEAPWDGREGRKIPKNIDGICSTEAERHHLWNSPAHWRRPPVWYIGCLWFDSHLRMAYIRKVVNIDFLMMFTRLLNTIHVCIYVHIHTYITLHYITLHCITLHYITLHIYIYIQCIMYPLMINIYTSQSSGASSVQGSNLRSPEQTNSQWLGFKRPLIGNQVFSLQSLAEHIPTHNSHNNIEDCNFSLPPILGFRLKVVATCGY